ncbi:sugar porter family MFS transporter [Acetobacteraceae bacterium ESL0709]|nr:sugar porter family MFS transporter [Acetobacteraceae bacterium ESL0697]MDF7677306.1 sugar porter family MFS transporter [Acetobacteraceae bacterium ESL0709]
MTRISENSAGGGLPRTDNDKARKYVLVICLLAALSGLLTGLDIGIISGVLGPFGSEFHASTIQLEWVVGGMLAGDAVGATFGGFFTQYLGRKATLILAAALFFIGASGCAMSGSTSAMIAFRVVVGVGLGLCDLTGPLYLSEIATTSQRGAMGSLYQLLKTVGIFLAFVSNSFLAFTGSWRAMLMVEALPALIFMIIFIFLPRSPRWLMINGRSEEALETLFSLRETEAEARQELAAMEEQLKVRQDGWHLLKNNRNFRRSVGLGMLLMVMQQFAGINIIMYYAPKILAAAGFSDQAQMWCTALIGLLNMLMTLVAVRYADRWGRKPILYAGYASMAGAMMCMAIILGIGPSTAGLQLAALAMILIFVGGFAMSAGPLMWVICSEIQPLAGRNLGLSISTGTNALSNLLVGTTFLSMMEGLGSAATFWIFAVFNILAIILLYFFVPETKDVPLETIEKRLMSGVRLRNLGR